MISWLRRLPNQAVPTESKALALDKVHPPVAVANGCRVGKEAVLLLLRCQAGELIATWIVGGHEGLLAVKDRWVANKSLCHRRRHSHPGEFSREEHR